MKLVLAEKLSVAQSIAKVLGATKREDNRSGRKVISYIGCNFFMTLLTRKLGMCIIKICKENLAWRCFYEKGRNLKCKQKRTSQ